MAVYRMFTPNLTGGIASKDILSRSDLEKYATFLKQCKNGIIKPYGGVYKRNGTLFVAEAIKDGNIRLINFKQPDSGYLLELTDKLMVIRLQGNEVAKIKTPFTSDMLPNIKATQSANVMFLCCGDLPIQELRRTGDKWTLKQFNIKIPPFKEIQTGVNFKASNATESGEVSTDVDFYTADMIGESFKVVQRVKTVAEDMKVTIDQQLGEKRLGGVCRLILSGEWEGTVKVYSKWRDWKLIGTHTTNGTFVLNSSEYAMHTYKALITVTKGTVVVRFEADGRTSAGSGGEGD